jgi:uncharacterized membrane protein
MDRYGDPGRDRGAPGALELRPLDRGSSNGRLQRAERRARGLGWFSIALGLGQLLGRGTLAERIGVGEGARTERAMLGVAVRELLCGVGLLSRRRPAFWLWARVAGDIMDLGLLGGALGLRRANRPKLLSSMASVAGILLLDAATAVQMSRSRGAVVQRRGRRGPIHVTKSITVARSPEEVYRFWHDFQNLPRFMAHLESVTAVNGRSHWRARGMAKNTVEWDAELVEDRPNKLLAWRSLGGADVASTGTVHFAPAEGDRGTVIRVDLRYDASRRRASSTLAKIFGEDPATQLENDLRRFKQVMETGEVVHSDASIHRGPHPARPPSPEELEALR